VQRQRRLYRDRVKKPFSVFNYFTNELINSSHDLEGGNLQAVGLGCSCQHLNAIHNQSTSSLLNLSHFLILKKNQYSVVIQPKVADAVQ